MKNTFLKFALMGIVAVGAVVACNNDASDVKPTVTGITPTIVAVGDTITITGTGLDQVISVGFIIDAKNVKVVEKTSFISASATSIKVAIPTDVTFPCSVQMTTPSASWETEILTTAAQAVVLEKASNDAFEFLLCSNNAYETAGKDDTSPEYAKEIQQCLTKLPMQDLSFDNEGIPTNDYTTVLYCAIPKTVTVLFTGHTPAAIARSRAGNHSRM
jgi:hypothetical protein